MRHMSAFTFDVDVEAALGELCLEYVLKSLEHLQFPGVLVTALAEEGLELQVVGQIHCITIESIPFPRSVRQGGVESALEWHLVVRRILDSCHDQ